jgi:hypothetical protein
MTAKKRPSPEKRSSSKPPASAGGRRYSPREKPVRFAVLIASLVFVVSLCLLYPGQVFQDKIFFASDNQAAASFSAAAKAASDDGFPVWNPYLFSGMPSFGSLSYTPYVYPVNYVVRLLVRFLFFPKYTWFLIHVFLLSLGTFLLLRDRGVGFGPSVLAGVLMVWMPNLVAVGANGHGSQACAVAFIPFALLFWDRVWRGRHIVSNAAALTIVLGLSMLRGHLQI